MSARVFGFCLGIVIYLGMIALTSIGVEYLIVLAIKKSSQTEVYNSLWSVALTIFIWWAITSFYRGYKEARDARK